MSGRQSDNDAAAEKASRDRLAAGLAAYKAVPESRKTQVANPGKYSFPVGVDEDGKPFPNEKQPPRS